MSAWGLLSCDQLSRMTSRDPAQSVEKASPTAEVVVQKSATHFAVLPGLRKVNFSAWQQLLPEGECGAVMSAYLRSEYSRLRTRIAEMEKKCDQMSLAKFVSAGFSSESWQDALQQTAKEAAAACLYKASWTENHQWLHSVELSDSTWVQYDDRLANEITDMMSALSEAVTRARTSNILSGCDASILDRVPVAHPPRSPRREGEVEHPPSPRTPRGTTEYVRAWSRPRLGSTHSAQRSQSSAGGARR